MLKILVPIALLTGCAHQGTPEGPPLSESEKQQAVALLRVAEVPDTQLAHDAQRHLVRITNEQKCPCPDKGTLAECAVQAGECVRARFAVRRVVRGLARNEKEQQIVARLLERFGPREPEEINVSDVPCRGNKDALVTMVVFSDFQCPFCGMGAKLTEKVEQVVGEKLQVCFKNWPLIRIHKKAQLAAQATMAALLQGKFWKMHDRLFAHQKSLDRSDLVDHAEAIGLDVERFKRDLDSDQVVKRVSKDARDAEALLLEGTPTFLINGRRMTDPKTIPDFLDWIAEAVALKKAEKKKEPSSAPTR